MWEIKESMDKFWQNLSLEEMSDSQWESICDGCGRCCLQKLECEDTAEIFYTNLACELFNEKSCQCKDYQHRFQKVPNCLSLKTLKEDEWQFMPTTCAYRLLNEGQGLMPWHPLIVGDNSEMIKQGLSVKGKVVSETSVAEEDFEDHIVTWVEC